MIRVSRQTQESGDESVNLQASRDINTNQGVTAAEVVSIANQVYRDNFLNLSGVAAALGQARASSFLEEFLESAEARGTELRRAHDPDVQYALFTAQRDYARSGDDNLRILLVDLLIQKFEAESGKLIDIVLSEAIETAGKLTVPQVHALTVKWLVTRVVFGGITSIDTLTSRVTADVMPFVDGVPDGRADYEHMQYTGCASIEVGYIGVGNAMGATYPGLFRLAWIWPPFPRHFGSLLNETSCSIQVCESRDVSK
jgi:hypothetical protein